ncbi:hypothetical protein [Pandoraea capi]|uniref:hypothetical protein n=1 Tax=Pandoraea capi TaxID=2508286 RepID=UPI00123F903E|nr:hypothetical protein [Pandoraea capi]
MTRVSMSAVMAREERTSIRLFAVRRIDSQENLCSLEGVANRQDLRGAETQAPRRVQRRHDALRADIVSVRALRAPGGVGGSGGVAAVAPTAPEAVADTRPRAGRPGRPNRPCGDPPPPYAPPGCEPEALASCAPPPYVASGAVQVSGWMLPPPRYSRPSLDWYLREGHPRSDV